MSTSQQHAYRTPAVEKSVMILDYLCHSEKGMSLRDIYESLEIPKTTAFSILNALVYCGLVQKNKEGLFLPTLKLFTMGIQARAVINKERVCLPYLEKLRNDTGFTVFFSMYDNGEHVVLEKLNGFGSVITFKAHIGERKRMNTSSNGKAIAAYLSPAEQEVMFSKGLDHFTANSISTKEDLLAHFKIIREQGYAVDDEEGEIGVRCLGIPIHIGNSLVYGAISIATLKDKLPYEDFPKYVGMLKATATDIAAALDLEDSEKENCICPI